MISLDKDKLMSTATLIVSMFALGFAAKSRKDSKKASEEHDALNNTLMNKLNMSIDDFLRKNTIDISDSMLSAAVNQAAENAMANYGKDAVKEAGYRVLTDIENQVTEAIDEMKDDVAPEVKKKLESKAAKVSIDDIKQDVINQVTKEAEDKISAEMDAILRKHQQQLDSIQQIYNNLGAAVKGGYDVVEA